MLFHSTPRHPTTKNHLELSSPALNRQWEGTGPTSNFLSHLVDLRDLTTSDLCLEVLELVITLGKCALDLFANLDALVNIIGNFLEVFLAEASGGHGWCTDTDTARGKSGLVTRDGVLVASNVDLLQDGFDTCAIESLWAEIKEDHVRVSSVSHELVAELLELSLNGLSVLHDLLLVLLEFRGGSLLESNSEGGDGVVVGSTLMAGENGEVDRAFKVIQSLLTSLSISLANTFAEEDHGATRTTERFVRSRSNDISVLEWAGDDTGSNETRDVSHVDDKVCANKVCDLSHASIVDQTAVCGSTSNQDLGSVHQSILLQFVIIDDSSLEVYTVWEGFEVGRDSGDPGFGFSFRS